MTDQQPESPDYEQLRVSVEHLVHYVAELERRLYLAELDIKTFRQVLSDMAGTASRRAQLKNKGTNSHPNIPEWNMQDPE